MEKFDLAFLLLAILPILLAITLSEAACGYMARYCGDRTAETMGRLSLNPAKYIDIVGTIIVPAFTLIVLQGYFMVGWAKPVPIDPRNFTNLRKGERLGGHCQPAGQSADVSRLDDCGDYQSLGTGVFSGTNDADGNNGYAV